MQKDAEDILEKREVSVLRASIIYGLIEQLLAACTDFINFVPVINYYALYVTLNSYTDEEPSIYSHMYISVKRSVFSTLQLIASYTRITLCNTNFNYYHNDCSLSCV